MPRNRLRVCTAMTARHLLPAKTGIRIPRVVLIYLQTHERRHMRYPLLAQVLSGITTDALATVSAARTT